MNDYLKKQILKADARDKELVINYITGKNGNMQNIPIFFNVLDTGCDNGTFLNRLKQNIFYHNMHGIDISPVAKRKSEKLGIKVSLQDLNQNLSYKDNSFDLIISLQTIEHLYFTDTYLREMKRILKKNGTLAITTTNLAAIHYRLMLLFGIQPLCLHPSIYQTFPLKGKNPLYCHKSVFTYKALKQVLKIHGFNIVWSRTHNIYFLPTWLSDALTYIFPSTGSHSIFVVKK